jgi:hypothetical protein
MFPFLIVLVALASAFTVVDASTTTATATAEAAVAVAVAPGAFVLEGVSLPETKIVDGVTLFRNGEGVRMFSFLGMNVRIYVAGFWTTEQLQSVEEVMACPNQKQFDFVFLRSVGQGRVKAAWEHQLDVSVSYEYDGYEQDREAFINMFGPLDKGGTESVLMIGNETRCIDQGVVKGIIYGKHFQRAFLSMWFGELAVQTELKFGLLGLARPKVMATA